MIDTDLVARFDDPPREYGPTPLWWWSGGKVTREGIRWQLERFADGRIDNLVLMNLAPKGPTYGALPDEPAWFSDEWWELLAYTCDVARERGMKLWFYDQIGFSGANIQGQITSQHPEATGRAIRCREAIVGASGNLPLLPREHLVGVYGERLGDDGWRTLEWSDGRVNAAEGAAVRVVTWAEKAFDYLDVKAVALLIDSVHGEYLRRVGDHVGTTIVGSFQDELSAMPTWSKGFLAAFERLAGYDLAPHLPSLWDRSTDADCRIRYDYHRVRTQLAEEAFFRPLGDWHRERGMLIGTDPTNPARAGFPTQGVQLYADYFATHRWFNAAGSDHEGDARIHSSMADLYDHPRVWIESFHSSGWGGTLEDTWDWLLPFFRSGANLYNPHASYFGLQAGWFEWAPPSTDFRQPYYAVYPQFSTAVARTAALLTWGRHVVDVGLLYPSTTVQALLPPGLPVDYSSNGDLGGDFALVDETQQTYLALAGTNNWFRPTPGLFDGIGVDFDVIDDDSILASNAEHAALRVNGFAFRTIVLPSVDYLAPGVADRLIELLDAGGQVIVVGRAPRHVAGRGTDDTAVERLTEHPRLVRVATPAEAARLVGERSPYAWAEQGIRAQRSGGIGLAFLPGAFPNASAYPPQRQPDSNNWDDHDVDPARYAERTELRVGVSIVEAELWNPATGVRRPLAFSVEGDSSRIFVEMGGAPAVFVVWREGAAPERSSPAAPSSDPSDPGKGDPGKGDPGRYESFDDGWTQQLVPTLDNRWGDFALPASTDDIPLELWRLTWRDGDAEPVPTRVTFGQQVLVAGPFDVAAGPAPLDVAGAEAARSGSPLGGEGWSVQQYSLSQGADKDAESVMGSKGFVKEEFLSHAMPAPGQEVGLRALIRVDEPGDYEITISAPGPKRLWIDGIERTGDDRGYAMTVTVSLGERVAVLEYRLGKPELPSRMLGNRSGRMTAYFTIDRPGARPARPEFIAPGAGGISDGVAVFRRHFTLDADAERVTAVTGAASGLTLEMDGVTVARQKKVEYYESGTGDYPSFFTHQLEPLAAGSHELRLTADSADPDNPIFFDMLLETASGRRVVVSDDNWTVGHADSPAEFRRGRSGGLTYARAALRPHPLAAAHWLVGDPAVGDLAVRFESAVSTVERSQTFTVTLPAGTRRLELAADPTSASIDGVPVKITSRTVSLDAPLAAPAELEVVVAPRAFSVGGAAWEGPILVSTESAPARFGDWADLGLGAWSGAVRYTRDFETRAARKLRLDLGRVRGAVEVSIDGSSPVTAFCAPFTFDLGKLEPGVHHIAVTVYGTLAPRYDSATPSTSYTQSQLATGIFGPVRLHYS